MIGELKLNNIYNCDYKERINSIGDQSFDMVLTDIPYGVSKQTNFKSIKDYEKKDGDSTWKGLEFNCDSVEFDVEDYLFHCCRILKPSSSIIVWASWQQLKMVDDIIKKYLGKEKGEPRIGIWRKTNPTVFNMDKMAIQPYEFFIWNSKGSKAIFNNQNGKYLDTDKVRQHPEIHFYDYSAPRNFRLEGKHENAKPVEILEWLIYTYTNEINNDGERSVVFDGCIGGGATAIAALRTKRNFIGFEINKNYFEIAKERIKKQINKQNS
jgi:site-specific DNA-methyltransferase (adenine-specific)